MINSSIYLAITIGFIHTDTLMHILTLYIYTYIYMMYYYNVSIYVRLVKALKANIRI